MGVDQSLVSNNKKWFAIMQSDGNFCVYNGKPGHDPKYFKWGTYQSSGEKYHLEHCNKWRVKMQSDGNLCVYRHNDFRWGSHQTCNTPLFYSPEYRLTMQDDGNLCVYENNNFKMGSYQDAIRIGRKYDLY